MPTEAHEQNKPCIIPVHKTQNKERLENKERIQVHLTIEQNCCMLRSYSLILFYLILIKKLT